MKSAAPAPAAAARNLKELGEKQHSKHSATNSTTEHYGTVPA